mmetsp:Transcript_35615/g.107161  ORF Transcript_35615/g.107161 Transcript_35615/m.107161 type:complete len:428 (-) Transcript_35615:303-1586(-)
MNVLGRCTGGGVPVPDDDALVAAAVEQSKHYFTEHEAGAFVPVGDRLSLGTLSAYLRTTLAYPSDLKKDAIRIVIATVQAQSILAKQMDHRILVGVIEATRAVHRASFQMALSGIHREGSCDAYLKRVSEVTKSIARVQYLAIPRQDTSDLSQLYEHAQSVRLRHQRLLEKLSKCSGGHYHETPLKSEVRTLEKAWLKPDGVDRGNCASVCDIVRGGVEYETMSKLLLAFELILACEAGQPNAKLDGSLLGENVDNIVILRIKDRFNEPNASGYADTMINFYFADDVNRHVCEIQLIHSQLMTIRKEQKSHNFNNRTRSAIELLESVGKDELVPEVSKVHFTCLATELEEVKRTLSHFVSEAEINKSCVDHTPLATPDEHNVSRSLALQTERNNTEIARLKQELHVQSGVIAKLVSRIATLEKEATA